MEQNLLLTTARLKLGSDLQRGWNSHGAFVIKNVPLQIYLTVSREQAAVLDAFSEGATVPEVFARLLRERRCLPLREFYELVLKACEAGVLCTGAVSGPPRRALTWPGCNIGAGGAYPVAALTILVLVALGVRADVWASNWSAVGLFTGALLSSVALSLGQALAATFLAGAGGEVYAMKRIRSLAAAHLRLDLRDERLSRPAERAWIALAETVPLALALLVVSIAWPAAGAPLALAWMLVWRPWGDGLPRRLASLLSRYPKLDTDEDFLFHPNQGPQLHWRPWWRRWDWRVCGLGLAAAAVWIVLAARLVLGATGVGFAEALETVAGYWFVALPGVISALSLLLVAVLVRRWRDGLQGAWRTAKQGWSRHLRRRREHAFPDTEASMLRIVASHPVLSLLNPYDRAAIVRSWKPACFPARRPLAGEGGPGRHVGLILSGCAVATRRTTSGRRVRALTLEEGDFFGLPPAGAEVGGEATLEARGATPVAALLIPAEMFQRCVIEKIGAQLVYDLTHKLVFLRRLKVCEHWDAHAVGRFARLAQVAAYRDGEAIVREGEDTKWFYIVYDGVAQVRRGEKLVSRLKSGDFFGEISLLQNSAAVANVVAQGSARCLQIDRNSFLRFMTHNHHVALALERISSARLGHPIFPLRMAPIGSANPFVDEARRSVCFS